MLNVSIGTLFFGLGYMHQHQGHSKNLNPKFETVTTHACIDNKTPKLVCGFSNVRIDFTIHRGVEKLKGQYIRHTSN